MAETPLSLLERLRALPDPSAWKRLVELYTPLIQTFLRRHGLQHPDVDDLVQDVLAVVVEKLPDFRHNAQKGAFRTWLRTITAHRLQAFLRSARYRPTVGSVELEETLHQLEAPDSTLSRSWDQEHDQQVLRRLLELLEGDFTSPTWQAFRRVALEGIAPAAVAAELGVSVNAVYQAKAQVLGRLREEARGLVD